jgi:hypothetical protein
MAELSLPATLAAMTEHAARLRRLLETFPAAELAARAGNGGWSAIENVRHAFYAEQHHMGRYLPGGLGLSAMGMHQGARAQRPVHLEPSVSAVFDEWERVHAELCERLDFAQPALANLLPLEVQLPRLWRHQQQHARAALRALSEVTGRAVRLPRAP